MLCERLRSLRLARGLSQVQLAEKVGISNNLYNKYEKKDVRPPYETRVKIADALGVSVSVLLDEIAAYPSEPIINMPIVGSVRAGMDGNIVSDDTGDTRRIAAAALHGRPDEYFLLRVLILRDLVERVDCFKDRIVVTFRTAFTPPEPPAGGSRNASLGDPKRELREPALIVEWDFWAVVFPRR